MILRATKMHAQNLAVYVAMYKAIMLLLAQLNGGKEVAMHPFISGFIPGYLIFGKNTPVNKQVNTKPPIFLIP